MAHGFIRSPISRCFLGAGVLAVSLTVVLALGATTALAKNQWNDYHWESPTNGDQLAINVNNCQTDPGLFYYSIEQSFDNPNAIWEAEIILPLCMPAAR